MKADDRKKAILDCAKKLFSNQGYYQTHISDIINEAKIARGTIYQYFDNKDDIFITLVEEFYNNWRTRVSFELANIDLNTISAKDYLRHRIKQTLVFLAEDSDLCNIALRIGLGLPEKVSILINRFEKKIMSRIIEDLKFGQENKTVIDTLNIETTAVIFTGGLLRTAHHYFVKKKKQKGYSLKEIEKISEDFVRVFAPGILVPKNNP